MKNAKASPEVESFIISWTFFEQIHSRSYTHILRNIYSDPSEIFDTILDVPEIAACAKDINKYYDDLFNFPIESIYQVGFAKGNNGLAKQINSSEANTKQTAIFEYPKDNLYEYKKRLWLCLNAVNALEGIRFYASFACSWAFAEVGKMEGNAKIIKLIARDENIHLAFTQQLLKILPKEDKDFVQIQKDCEGQVRQIFSDVLKQEQDWFKYVFRDGSIIGLNETLGCTYLEWLTAKRMAAIGLKMETEITNNPLPWTQKWIAGSDVQVAPQETQITQYIQGGLKKDLEAGLSGLSLGD